MGGNGPFMLGAAHDLMCSLYCLEEGGFAVGLDGHVVVSCSARIHSKRCGEG